MIEDELRSLLTERADTLRDNPGRAAEVRSRIAGIRRRRIAGAALGLVLVALAGLAVLRLPGTNESLPPGVPGPPWFDPLGRATVTGYTSVGGPPQFTGPVEHFVVIPPGGTFRYLLVARCPQPAALTVRNLGNGARVTADCSRRVGDHYEGSAAFDAQRADELLAQTPDGVNVRFEPGSAGAWDADILGSNDPDRLGPPGSLDRPWVAEGTRTRQGTTTDITIPAKRGPDAGDVAMSVSVECVAGVRLVMSVPTGELLTADCDPSRDTNGDLTAMSRGRVQHFVTDEQLARLGLRAGDRVPLTIRSVGRDTDQWRVFPIN